MGDDDEQYRRNEQPGFVADKKLFGNKENKTRKKNNQRKRAVVVFFVPVVQRIRTNAKGQDNHSCFKNYIMNDIDSKQWQAAEEQRQQGAMDGAGQRCPDAQCVPIDLQFHGKGQMYKKATMLQKKRTAIA